MLALHDSNREYWMICLSSTVGYIMPIPTLQLKSSTKLENAREKMSCDREFFIKDVQLEILT